LCRAFFPNRCNPATRRINDREFWLRGNGPQDYDQLNDEFSRVLEGVSDTVFLFVMRRYHMDEQADLFEQNRTEFEIQREIGRRVVYRVDDEGGKDADRFRKEYGEEALQRVLSRSRDLRGERG
jgi:hypothetical protein